MNQFTFSLTSNTLQRKRPIPTNSIFYSPTTFPPQSGDLVAYIHTHSETRQFYPLCGSPRHVSSRSLSACRRTVPTRWRRRVLSLSLSLPPTRVQLARGKWTIMFEEFAPDSPGAGGNRIGAPAADGISR